MAVLLREGAQVIHFVVPGEMLTPDTFRPLRVFVAKANKGLISCGQCEYKRTLPDDIRPGTHDSQVCRVCILKCPHQHLERVPTVAVRDDSPEPFKVPGMGGKPYNSP